MKYIVALAAFLVAAPVWAGDCHPVEKLASNLAAQGIALEPVRGAAKARAIALYNRLPPPSNEQWESVFMFEARNGVRYFVFGKGIDVCANFEVPVSMWPRVKAAIFGADA